MIPQEYNKLIDLLQQRTDEKKLQWSTTSDSQKFQLAVKSNTLTIENFTTYPEEMQCVGMRIINENGDQIDWVGVLEGDSGYDKMWDLFYSARRSALKIEETIAAIIEGIS